MVLQSIAAARCADPLSLPRNRSTALQHRAYFAKRRAAQDERFATQQVSEPQRLLAFVSRANDDGLHINFVKQSRYAFGITLQGPATSRAVGADAERDHGGGRGYACQQLGGEFAVTLGEPHFKAAVLHGPSEGFHHRQIAHHLMPHRARGQANAESRVEAAIEPLLLWRNLLGVAYAHGSVGE